MKPGDFSGGKPDNTLMSSKGWMAAGSLAGNVSSAH